MQDKINSNKDNDLQSQVDKVLDELEPKKREILISALVELEQSYSGPLPSPRDFAAYKATLPDAPERILSMTEKEQAHRHKAEEKILDTRNRENLIGQIMAFLLVLACLGAALALGLSGHDALAGTIVAITAIIASIFVLRKFPNQKKQNDQ